MIFTIRKAKAQDAESILALEAGLEPYSRWGLEGIKREFENSHAVILVAARDGQDVGYAAVRLLPPEAQLLNIAVASGELRKGVGLALLRQLAATASSCGCDRITLEVNERNAPARALYAKSGFEIVGRRPKFYNNSDDAVLMDYRIKS